MIPTNSETHRDIQSVRCVTMYFEIDYALFMHNGGSTVTTTNWMTSVFNNVQTLFNNDGISIALKSLYIWTSPDPYEGMGSSSLAYLNAFHTTRPVFDGDVGQLLGIDPGDLGGIARGTSTLCTPRNENYSDVDFAFSTVPIFSWTVHLIAHEFGHLLGSRHTHACAWNGNNTAIDGCYGPDGTCSTGPIPPAGGGTIMSYCHLNIGINLANGFGPQPAQAILNAVNGGTCLSFDCVNTCINTVSAINTTNITPNSVSISWVDLNPAQNSWEVAITPVITLVSTPPIVYNTVIQNSFSISGLSPNTYYYILLRPLCNPLTAYIRVKIFATTVADFCANTSFTDTGGSFYNYGYDQSWTRTMVPTGPGLKIKVTFTSFNLAASDYLYIYDGTNDTFPDLTLGVGLTGTTIPSPYTATSVSGALTFKFLSDLANQAPGWDAVISCTGTLDDESNDYIDFSYFPNPTNGNVNITSRSPITQVTVYNVTGQLLYKNSLNDLNTDVDIAQFAVGTYFFKLKFEGDAEVNFKILKK